MVMEMLEFIFYMSLKVLFTSCVCNAEFRAPLK